MDAPSRSVSLIYVYFDGDDVGPQLELRLLDNKVEDAREYSRSVRDAIARVQEILEAAGIVDVIAAGGDDIIVSWPAEVVSQQKIEEVRNAFLQLSGRSMSVGIGTSPREAAENLHRAKLMGKNQAIYPLTAMQ
jgi:GTP cyclohydrolase III